MVKERRFMRLREGLVREQVVVMKERKASLQGGGTGGVM